MARGESQHPELMVDFIVSLDGYAAADDWPGLWGLGGPEYFAWLGQLPENNNSLLMGANTYRLMSGFAAEAVDDFAEMTARSKVVFSSTLQEPLSWENTRLVAGDAVEEVRAMKENGRRLDEHDGKPQSLPIPPEGRSGRPLPAGRLPRDHGQLGPGADLRRVSRRLTEAGGAARRSTAGSSCSSTSPASSPSLRVQTHP